MIGIEDRRYLINEYLKIFKNENTKYIEYIKQPLQFIGNHKIMALATSGVMSVFFAITQWIGNSMLFLSTVLVINISFYIFVFYTFHS